MKVILFYRDVSDGFYHSTPINRRNVASTPNLSTTNGDGVYQSLLDEPLDTFLHSSTHSVPRKSSLMDKSGDEMKKAPSSSGSVKGVHFCPVVSEVSWNESSGSSDEEQEEEDEEQDDESGEEDDASSVSVGSEGSERSECSDVSEPPTDECKEVETREVVVNKTEAVHVAVPLHAPRQPPPPPPIRDHVTVLHSSAPSLRLEPEQKAAPTGKEAVGAMEPAAADGPTRQSRSAKLGSFLSRFASFRFSGRKDKKQKQQKNGQQQQQNESNSKKSNNKSVNNHQEQKNSKTVDYIYIPLKGPLPSSTPVENVVTSKPPLPRAPPPQRSASARATTGGGTDRRRGERDGRATIDQVGGGSVAGTVTTSDRRSGTVRNACSMEPMGLIETDLDTQVTVITAGTAAHVKTRSLMNLGPAPQPLQGIALPPQQDQRPHKSMEFLLDKENLKTVQVSHEHDREGHSGR